MLTKTLVASQIEDGRRLLEELQKKGLNPRAAFWFFDSYKNEWRLMIQLPLVDEVYHRKAYERVERIRRSLKPAVAIELSDIALQSAESPLVSAVRRAIRKSKTNYREQPLVYVGQNVDVQFIDDVYAYLV